MRFPRLGFRAQSVYRLKRPSLLHVAKQRISFVVASMSLFAFVIGNMVGQHGWYAFWKSVMGRESDATIAFVGTVAPIGKIPDYSEWAKYGGNKQLHTFRQAPESVLRDLPVYDQMQLMNRAASSLAQQTYSTLWAGGYNGAQGSHAGVDIDAPRGTPVVSIANGVVEKVSMQDYGFGHYVLIRHPNVPDAGSPNGQTTLYSTYAHMDGVFVEEGEVLHKGQPIGTVGNTGLVFGSTGYHLYFEVDKEAAPYHPYWPFTSAEAAQAGLSFVQAVNSTRFRDNVVEYTINPMLFVQQYEQYVPRTTIAGDRASADPVTGALTHVPEGIRLRQMSAERGRQRMAKAGSTVQVAAVSDGHAAAAVSGSLQQSSSAPSLVTEVAQTAQVENATASPAGGSNTDVDHLSIEHSGKLSRTWQKIKIMTVDAQGRIVASPSFSGRLYLLSDFGEAEIRPGELGPLDFVNGVATVNVLTRSQKKTVFITTRGSFNTRSAPMVPVR